MTAERTTQRLEVRTARSLTRMQARIWASQRRHPDAPVSNMATRVRIDGPLDAERFVAAFDRVVRAADALRTVLVDDAAGTRTTVLADPSATTERIDLPLDELDEWCAGRVSVPLDATRCPYDSVLLRHGDDTWTWWLDIHHVVTDAVGSALVFEATASVYAGEEPRLGSFEDVRRTLRARETDPAWLAAHAAWRDRDATAPLTPYGPLGRRTARSDRLDLGLDAEEHAALGAALEGPYRAISRELGLLGVLVTAATVLVHRTDGCSTVTVGVPVHHRSGRGAARGAARVVGPLMEIFPLDVAVEPDDTYASLHRRVQRGLLDLLGRAVPGTSPDQDFGVVVNVLTARYADIAGLSCRTEWVHSGAVEPAHLLRVQAHDHRGDDLRLELDVNAALGDETTCARVPGHLRTILVDMVTTPDRGIGEVVLPSADELREIDRLNDGGTAAPPVVPVDVLIGERLAARRDEPVIEDGTAVVTAGELHDRADALASWLAARGVGAGDRVALRLPRSADAVIAVQGVLRSGAAFVMLDPGDPAHRHDLIVADSGCALVLDELPGGRDGPVAPSTPTTRTARSLDDLAYVLYTSGSTGEPKGVPISHRGLAGYLAFAAAAYVDPERPPTMALHSALVFDLTITSLFLPLLVGGRTIVFRGPPAEALAAVAADRRIDLLKATPSQLEVLLGFTDDLAGLRTLVVGGEAFRRPLACALTEAAGGDVAIYNEYGPTEAVVGCMIHRFDPEADQGPDVPIGRACPDSEIFVLDTHGRPAPQGSWGELHVRRPGMAAGYLNRASDDRFAVVPAVGGPPLYRTGDRVRVERPGVATYGGRLDDQLKIGGVRFEPGEIEAALIGHPAVQNAVVRMWRPAARPADVARCVRCGLGTDVPGVSLDADGVCPTCHAFDAVRPQAERWFRTPDELAARRDAARARRRGAHDCLHLLSGGKDSTYALYQLVAQGWEVHALTLDNGFISDGAKENIRRTVADLGVTHEFVTTDHMAEILRDSLERHSNVCNGCYKTIYTLAVNRAHELGIPVIVTGLSRGQFFETRLVPHQFDAEHFDPDEIDAAVLEARKAYHRTDDAVTRTLDTSLFADDAIFDEVEFVDFYRYVDVDLTELYRFLEEHAPWVRPTDTGRSTNCLVNVAGIHVHQMERGFHNYALPYSWDVKLGHKTRDAALAELDDDIDPAEVAELLARIGYQPRRREVLTAWYQADDEIDPEELRRHLRDLLPPHAIPAAFVRLGDIPLAPSAKVDVAALPAPTRIHRAGGGHVPPTDAVEARLCELWGEVLGIERVGIDDDFFDLGGDSLAALDMITRVGEGFGIEVPDALAFRCRTVRELAVEVRSAGGTGPVAEAAHGPTTVGRGAGRPGEGHAPPAAIERVDEPVLSVGQEALLFEVLADPASPRFGVTRRFELDPPVDPARFRAALEAVVAAHEPLHLTVTEPRRELAPSEALEWRSLPAGSDPATVARSQSRELFDLDRGPLVRATMLEDGSALVLSLHHLWCAGGSVGVLWDDLALAYRGDPLPERPVRYRDYAGWQRARGGEADLAFWRDALPDDLAAPQLALARPAVAEPDGELHVAVSVERGTPGLFARFLAAVDAVLSECTDDTVVVGVPVTTREVPEVEHLVGHFMNEVVLTLPPTRGQRFPALAEEIQARLSAALRHRALPLVEVVADRRHRGATTDLVRVLAVHHPGSTVRLPGIEVRDEHVLSGDAVTELSLFLIEQHDGVEVAAEWSGARFAAADVAHLLASVAAVLEGATVDPEAAVDDLVAPLRPTDLVGPPLDGPLAPVTDAIWARRSSDDLAVTQGATRLTYAELLTQADRVAAHLVAAGVREGDRVALVLRRSPGLVAAVLGVLRAGAAYVPIDPDHPPARIATVVATSSVALVIVDERADVPPVPVPTRRLADLLEPLAPLDGAPDLPPPPTLDGPAYVIHTSGSTGAPRGVLVGHRQLAASTAARAAHYGHVPDRFLWTSSYGFDSSVAGLFWTLSGGGALVLPDDASATDVDHLVARAAEAEVTHVLTVPSLWAAMLARGGAALPSLRTVVVAGEACPAGLVARHHEAAPDVDLWNEYGPTETTVWATVHRCEPGEVPVPIGRPVPGAVVRVAGADLRSRPIGVAGELLVGGDGLTDGYVGDPEATAQRFVVDAAGRAFYRTGDRARQRADGVLEFLGRVDDQLSIRGMRVEPEEIERAILAVDGVRGAVVRGEPNRPADLAEAIDLLPPADARALLRRAERAERPGVGLLEGVAALRGTPPVLVAHVEADDLDERTLRAAVAEHLPSALVPARFVRHDRLPRNVHGKVDRAAVPLAPARIAVPPAAPDGGGAQGTTGSTAALAARIAALWHEVLGDSSIGVETDLFETGADSLTALEVVTVMSRTLGVEVGVQLLLEARTPAAIAEVLRSSAVAADDDRLLVLQAGRTGPPLFVVGQYMATQMLLGYLPLVSRLPEDLRVVGVRRTVPDDEVWEPTIEEAAEVCLAAMLEAQPEGPLRVFGGSLNGIIALEVAARWRAAGRDVSFVALGDTPYPGYYEPESRYLWERRIAKYRTLVERGELRHAALDAATFVRRRFRSSPASPPTEPLGEPLGAAPAGAATGGVRRADRALVLDGRTYRPPDRDFDLVLYAAAKSGTDLTVTPWRARYPDLHVVTVPGRHRGPRAYLRAENVGPLAADLTARLTAARRPH